MAAELASTGWALWPTPQPGGTGMLVPRLSWLEGSYELCYWVVPFGSAVQVQWLQHALLNADLMLCSVPWAGCLCLGPLCACR